MASINNNSFLIASKEKALLDTLAQHGLSTGGLSGRDIYDYVVESLRIEPSHLLSLSCRELKKIACHYRSRAPQKLYEEINKLKKGNAL